MLQHLEQWGLSLWLHQTIMVPLGWRNSPLWSPQWRAPETSFCSSPCSFPFTPSALLPLTPSGERLKTVGWRLLFWEGQGARGRVKNNILYSRAWTAPPAHQTSNKYGYRLIKNKEREEKKNERATFLWQRFTASLITGSSLSSPTSIHSAHCSLYQLYLRIPSVGTERCRMLHRDRVDNSDRSLGCNHHDFWIQNNWTTIAWVSGVQALWNHCNTGYFQSLVWGPIKYIYK